MAAFDKVMSGFPSLDGILDFIRMGDNVVWQVGSLDEFRILARRFAVQAIADGRNLIYVRFAQHGPVLEPMEGLKICRFNPDEGFETFTVDIYRMIEREGREAFYVFDSLSELQSAWYTDLMMGNFFQLTCPYLFSLDTVAYFPLLRGRHSFDTVAKIRDTTQLLLDIYANGDTMYIHPLKVWNRYSDRMFMAHEGSAANGEFRMLNTGVAVSEYYRLREELASEAENQSIDSYDRFFALAKMEYQRGNFTDEMEDMIIDSTMTKDSVLKQLIKRYFEPEDYFRIRNRMIGSGAIGGKACGVLLARRILKTNVEEYRTLSEPHDSYYIGSDVFYSYIVHNRCWNLRIRQRTEEGFFSEAGELKEALLGGEFPADIREQFQNLLEYYGQSPVIVRSSSFLEDGFGNAFAGKYESVFCVNGGTPEERLEEFERAVKIVYASTMDDSALEYRRQRGLEDRDEQMAVLVQRVSGAFYGDYFMPSAAGVGFSHSAYKWRPDMDPAAGMLRLVVGLGTRAVDRTENDYPRLVNLDAPSSTMLTTVADRHRFSQRKLDVLDRRTNRICERPLEELLEVMPQWYKQAVLEHDYEAEDTLSQMGRCQEVWFASCQRLLENQSFTSYMQKVLKTLEQEYQSPVDIEYTVNLDESGSFVVNLLQCRPLYTGKSGGRIEIPEVSGERIFFETRDSSMGGSTAEPIDAIVRIKAKEYYEYPHVKKAEVAEAVGAINQYYKETGKRVMLLAPGRIGTSSPELGVGVRFAQISGFAAICEVSDQNYGHIPELSYGSHMFQDLVEAEIIYTAILNNHKTLSYQPELFCGLKNQYSRICNVHPELENMIEVLEPEGLMYYVDTLDNHALCALCQ